ncbi:glycerophosphodiester phosphodiesterase family protein [Paenibacillus chondroitinus]|uniref:Glycerophosphodiester phosphodiesterase family protein n=1 Tax=Paenibacillus chondroitinus TaxID=59842 RepID=A0ABU6D956_9BACL|nr:MULTISPECIES: glycerophosphodiester phosphodiesterase family protein [Paenibacillus]MCY9661752.1 glycerophosphodiester phosphodiesterase family protein [Paenibacillus anseongense]MEB4793837.1 glycerophosphodiester phosphodiesterase family protein [Paenibacillus chondroitinus]
MSITDKNLGSKAIQWQAHQNSNSEVPENTMAAMNYAWNLGGIPEIDIRQTADGIIIGIHDATPKRTLSVPEADQDKLISELTFDQIQQWDAGVKFGEQFRNEKVPSLKQILAGLSEHSDRQLYLDFKQVDLEALAALIQEYGVARQIIFAHNNHENCKTVKRLVPEVRTMLWIPARFPETAVETFTHIRQTGFDSLNMVQLHLPDAEEKQSWRYKLQKTFIQEALQYLGEAGMELEVLPYKFDQEDLFELLDMGIRRYAVDEPSVFVELLNRYFN